jgi:zinc transporter ZupT
MLIFALSTPVGLIASVLFLGDLPREIIGNVVALSAGIFIYLGATDMLPEISHPGHAQEGSPHDPARPPSKWIAWEPTIWVLIGMILSFVPHLLLGDSGHHH